MSPIAIASSSARALEGETRLRIAARIAAVFAAAAHEWRIRRDLHLVGKLDDRALADIGIDPGGREAAVRTGRRASSLKTDLAGDRAAVPSGWTEWR